MKQLRFSISSRLRTAIISTMAMIGLVAAYIGWKPITGSYALDRFMASQYGAYDQSSGRWGLGEDGDAFNVYAICAQRSVRIRDERHVLLAVCGDTTDPSPSMHQPGITDLYVLKRQGSELVPTVSEKDIENGMLGHAGEIGVVQLGANFYGFKMASAWSGQGYVIETISLWAPNGTAMKTLLTYTGSSIFNGDPNCETEFCKDHEITRELLIDTRERNLATYPLKIVETLHLAGRSTKKTHSLKFSRTEWAYSIPSGFEPIVE